MASSPSFFFVLVVMVFALVNTASSQSLYPTFYQRVCPQALPTIKKIVEDAVQKERRMGASLLRLHFHDCFVNGCDASVLLDDTANFVGEKNALPNANSLRGFEVIDRIKSAVDKVCGGPIVSCADILAITARDSVVALGGPTWMVQLGRRDSTTANQTAANIDIPSPFLDLPGLIASFKKQGLGLRDLVALSGGHTVGFARCVTFRNHIYNETNIDPRFALALQGSCPRSGGDNNLSPLDSSPARFDVNYFKDLVGKRGLLHSDQVLFNGGSADGLVKGYSLNPGAFSADFAKSMVNMGNIKPLNWQ
ncbi:peroxidase 70-like protein [Cinnamomum micranthum f. kanehirae]|uniref:Peroxidase n=1 Tax=Cinnamomum micranthum f. kanehirae TaxID=337451 RepID=A0A3S4NT14_9MAGN|nr:peroxidase 70-like protein [Cinnamomum micranthum f. kanehirae]